jgi:hypothetical protein
MKSKLCFWSRWCFQVWITGYDSYPSNFYVHDNVFNGSYDRRRYVSDGRFSEVGKNQSCWAYYFHPLCWYQVALSWLLSICISSWTCRLTRSHTALSKNYTSNLRHYHERSSSKEEKNFVILWGTHHKTGTYLAQKVFALICSRQRWCCVFQPTRW